MSDRSVLASVSTLSHLPALVALARSVHATWETPPAIHVALVDHPDGPADHPALDALGISTVDARELGLPGWNWLATKYDERFLAYVVKPYLIRHLLDRGHPSVFYCDTDVLFTADGSPFLDLGPGAAFVVVPHMLRPFPAHARLGSPSMGDVALAGVLNSGMFLSREHPETRPFLETWGELMTGPGAFVPELSDQREQQAFNWITSFVEAVEIHRDPCVNVAYWNLHERRLAAPFQSGEPWTVGGRPLVSFHFSGFVPGEAVVTRHDRRGLHDLDPHLRRLCEHYDDELAAAADALGPLPPYRYGSLDGVEVSPEFRAGLRRAETQLGPLPDAGWEATLRGAAAALHRLLAPTPLVPEYVAKLVDARADLVPLFERGALYPGELLGWLAQGFPREGGVGEFYAAHSPFLVARHDPSVRIPAHEPATCVRFVYDQRPDLQAAFPDPMGEDREAFAAWLAQDLHRQYVLPGPVAALAADFDVDRALARVLARIQRHADIREAVRIQGLTAGLVRALAPEAADHHGFDATDLALAEWWACTRDAPANRALVAGVFPRVTAVADGPTDPGALNVLGHFASPIGLGTVSRGLVSAAATVGLRAHPVVLTNMTMNRDLTLEALASQPDPRCRTSVVTTFPHIDYDVLDVFPGAFGGDRETVAYLAWEQRMCPPRWAPRFAPFDRLFALSQFAADAIAEGFRRPCHALTCVVEVDGSAPPPSRADHDLPPDAFVVGMVLESASSLERKNPLGAVRAIARAFAGDPGVVVVLKVGGAFGQYDGGRVHEAVRILSEAGVALRLVTQVLGRPQVEALYRCMDVYVSLHRAEGFGYTMAEAMALGVPVVATGYSGNMEYMTAENSYPVAFAETAIERSEGPFGRGSLWAEPDVDHAAELLRHVRQHPQEAAARARRGQADVERQLSAQAVGRRLSELLG